MGKPVVFVIGASGYIGAATVQSLASKYSEKIEIHAGVRNPDGADNLKAIPGVTVVRAAMGDKENLKTTLRGVDTLYIVTSSGENRAQLTIATAEVAKDVGVKFLLVVSVSTAQVSDTVFGVQFGEIEDRIGQLGVPYTFLRLPFFLEIMYQWRFKDSIVSQGAIYGPADPEKPFTSVAVEDAGRAAAAILVDPSKHAGKTYDILSDRQTFGQIVEGLSEALSKDIKYNRISYEAAKQRFLGMGFPEWKANGLLELLKFIDSSTPELNIANLSDFENITGEKPTTLGDWISKNAHRLK